MKYIVTMEDEETSADIASLYDWLLRDDDLRGAAIDLYRVPAKPEDMGTVSDALQVVLGPHGTGVALAATLSVWIRSHRKRVKVHKRYPDGTEETIEVDGSKDPDLLARELQAGSDTE